MPEGGLFDERVRAGVRAMRALADADVGGRTLDAVLALHAMWAPASCLCLCDAGAARCAACAAGG